jgi:parallel beta-helix repeat protein
LPGDSITFDQSVFPPTSPDTIVLTSQLPALLQGNLTIDASDAGVIIDGSSITKPEAYGLSISSNNNVIRGLQIVYFSQAGIGLNGDAQNNIIGGDRDIGAGPLGQGNLVSGDGTFGIGLWSNGTSFNTIQGNFIGTDVSGTIELGSFSQGIFFDGANYNLVVDNLIGGYVDNGVGINIVIDGHNTVRGNYIGTDPSGLADLANSGSNGISIGSSSFNIVGPGNVIAHNNGHGIVVFGENSECNRITQNIVHDNDLGIYLFDGGNNELAAPLLFDFDRQAGTVAGITCANCKVEIFSDNTDEGEVYEGQTIADNAGIFSFNKGASFTGPRLTATVTDADGNTSRFSVPTPDMPSRTVILQEGNNLSKTRLQTKRSGELADNRIGGGWDLPWILDLGVKRASFCINEPEWSGVHWNRPEFEVAPWQDDYVTTLAANGLTLTNTLSFWDKANHPGRWEEEEKEEGYSRFQTEEEIQRYLEFVQFNVNHFKDRVRYFELWNEPDNGGFPVQYIRVPDYINLVKRVVPVIRQEYPEAKIVVGSVSNLLYTQNYFFELISSEEIMTLVDVVGWHPMYGPSPAYEDTREYYYDYPSIVQAIKDTAFANGFSGEYYVDEIGWASHEFPPPPDQHWVYTEIQSAKYLARGIVMHLGMDINTEVGDAYPSRVTSFALVQNLCTIMAGTSPDSVPVEIQRSAANIRSYGFSLPGGDRMIALWTDSVAVDNDPGVTATLTLPGLSDQRMTGIDVLNGFQQEMITEVENGNLVIRNLMVKDYPIILSSASAVDIATDRSPFTFALLQNYPNPFNRQTTITYELKENAQVSLKIYNIFGQLVETVVNDYKTAGYHSVLWNASNVSSGLYFYRIEAGEYTETRKCLILK